MAKANIGILVVVSVMLFGLAQIAGASTVTLQAWGPAGSTSQVFTITIGSYELPLNPDWSFGVYDYGAGTDVGSKLAMIDNTDTSASFQITDGGSTLQGSGGITKNGSIELSTASVFGFYFSDGSTNYFDYDSEKQEDGSYGFHITSPDSGGPVLVSNVSPVPIPATFLLLGSALLCLVGVRRRKG